MQNIIFGDDTGVVIDIIPLSDEDGQIITIPEDTSEIMIVWN